MLLALVFAMQRAKVWYTPLYAILGIVIWYAVLESGIHATIAGVALGLLTPATPLQRKVEPTDIVGSVVDPHDINAASARRASLYVRESVSVAERLQTLIHPFSSFVILPLFALANAGIALSGESIADASTSTVTLGVIAGLVVGKTLGVTAFTFAAVKSGICELPKGITWMMVTAVGMLAGIGFTVSLFITGLAFEGDALELLDTQARLGILLASLIASVLGLILLDRSTRSVAATPEEPDTVPTPAPTPVPAEV